MIVVMTITTILSWIWVNIFKLGILSLILFNIKKIIDIFILQPIQGDDKHTSMDELAKYVILALLCAAMYVNGTRETEWAPYSDATIAVLIAGVFSIAAIKPVVGIFTPKEKDSKIEPLDDK